MKILKLNYLIILMILSNLSFATIINIPADYPTIQEGIDAGSNYDTVLVQPSTYVENIYLEEQTVVLASLFLTTGDTSYISQTIIDGNDSGPVISFHYQNLHARGISKITGFTIQNGFGYYGGGIFCQDSDPIISNNHIVYNISETHGGGIFLWTCANPVIFENYIGFNTAQENGGGICVYWSHSNIHHNTISYNHAVTGGGIYFSESGHESQIPYLSNNLITHNEGVWACGGLYAQYSEFRVENTTIANNQSFSEYGLNVYLEQCEYVRILNTIIWGHGRLANMFTHSTHYDITYSNIEGGGYSGEGNIEEDPFFRDPNNNDFHLMAIECGDSCNSPCIDRGFALVVDSILDCSWGLGSEVSDMGAYGGNMSIVGINNPVVELPHKCILSQNYPNPFNASTIIEYSLTDPTNVKLDIYDVAGRHIKTLFDSYQSGGHWQVTWNAGDYSSGVYFYKLRTDEFNETKKMFLIK